MCTIIWSNLVKTVLVPANGGSVGGAVRSTARTGVYISISPLSIEAYAMYIYIHISNCTVSLLYITSTLSVEALSSHVPSLPIVSDTLLCWLQGTHKGVTSMHVTTRDGVTSTHVTTRERVLSIHVTKRERVSSIHIITREGVSVNTRHNKGAGAMSQWGCQLMSHVTIVF